MKKRILSILLAALMIISMIPFASMAVAAEDAVAVDEVLDELNQGLSKENTMDLAPGGTVTSLESAGAAGRKVIDFNDGWTFAIATQKTFMQNNWAAKRAFVENGFPEFEGFVTDEIIQPDFDDSEWRTVNTPHDWAIEQGWTRETGNQGGFAGGLGYYRKTFFVPDEIEANDERIIINFESIMQNPWVYLNGEFIGSYPNGYTGFAFDISDKVKYGQNNELVIRVNAAGAYSRWYYGAGIIRPVTVTVTGPLSFDRNGVFLTTPDLKDYYQNDGSAVLHVNADWTRTAKTVNHSVNMKTTVFDADGNKVAEAVALDDFDETATSGHFNYQLDVTVPNVKLWYPWNLGDPYRYTVRTELFGMKQGDTQVKTLDVVEEKFGFRWIEFQEVDLNDRSTGGCFVNGKYTKLWGVNLHQDSGPLGSAGLYDAFERQMKILESMGCNYFRTSHAPISKAQVEVCSDLGFLVMEESFDSWGNPKAAWDFGIFFLDPVPTDWPGLIPNGYVGSNLGQYLGVNYPGAVFTWSDWVTQEYIRRDRNEPCIFLWSMGNEIRGTYWPTYSAADEENGVMPEWYDRIRKVPVWYDGTKYDNEAVTGLQNNTRNDGVETYKIVKTEPGVAAGTNETNGDIYTEMVRLSEDAKVADNTRVVMTTCDQLRSDPWVTKDNQPDDMWGHVFRYDRFIGGQYIYPGAAESLTKIFNPANGYEFAAFLETESNIMGTTRGNVYGSRNNFGPSSSVNGHKGGSGYCNHNSWFGGNTKANKKYYRDAPSALGVTFWTGFDYMGEGGRINSGGSIDIAGFPKDYYYFYKALWMPKEKEKFAHLVPSEWSTWMPGEKIDVWTYTNVQSAELFLNGKSLGRKSFDIKETINGIQYYETSNYTNDDQSLTLIDKGDPFINTVNPGGYVSPAGTKIISASGDSEIAEGAPFGDTWLSWEDVVFEPGVLEVKCYDTPTSTEVVATDVLTTATNPYKVDMKAYGDKNVMKADGDSLIYVECDVVDEAGNPVYTADQNIEFYVSGAAAIAGTENGDNNQYDLYNRYYRVQYTSYSQHTAYGGKVLCILQSNGQEGDIQLIAKGDGLMPTVINFKATADGEGEAPAQTELAPEFVSADEPVFTVPTGVTPTLPTEIGVTYTDATIGTFTVGEAVVWDAVEASDSAKTFTVNGTAAGQPVKATVKVVKAEEKGDISTNTFQGSTLYEYASQGAANGYRFADFAEDSPVRDGALATSSFATGNPNAMLQANNSNWQNTFKGGGSNFVSNPITEIDTIPYSTVQFYWDDLKVFDSVDLTFVVSNPTDSASGTKIPAAFRAQYWDGNYWVDVENQEVALPEDTTSAGNKLVTVSFDAVLTSKIRIGMENGTPWTPDGGMRINRAIVNGWTLADAEEAALISVDAAPVVQVNTPITITVKSSTAVAGIGLVNENGKGIYTKVADCVDEDGVRTWTLTASIGSKGDRALKVYAKDEDGALTEDYLDLNIKVAQSVAEADETAEPTIISVDAPVLVAVKESFEMTVKTSTGVSGLALLTESGAGLGKSASYVDADGVRTWTVKTSIGTKGNRVITVKAKGADGSIVDEGAKTAEIVVTK